LSGPKEGNSNGFIFGLKYIFFYDVFIQVAFQFFLDEYLKFFEMAEFYLFLYYLIPN
jgi:thiamine transporter ThiT